MWLQFDWGVGPAIGGRPTPLFCVWLAWGLLQHRNPDP